jgi:branched-chain amino acid transport system substrate-binding protein
MKKFFPVLLLLIVLVSCDKHDRVVYDPLPKTTIGVGVLLALTGSGQSSGECSLASLQIASGDITAYFQANCPNYNLKIEFVDTKTDTAEALKQLKIFYEKGYRLVIGPYTSAELAAIRSFADDHGIFILSPASVSVSLAIPGDNIYRFVSSDVIQGQAMSKMLSEDKVNVIVPLIRNDVWGNDLLSATRKEFIKAGGEVAEPVAYPAGTTDFTQALSLLDQKVAELLKAHDPNDLAVYLLAYGEAKNILGNAKNFPNLNKVYWYGNSAFGQNAQVLTDTAAAKFAFTHGLPSPVFGLDDAAKYKWQPLSDRIKSVIGRPPDTYAFTAYDALWVITKSCMIAGENASIEKFQAIFTDVSNNYFGVTGNTALDLNGDRAFGNYDFWSIKKEADSFTWKCTARYNSANGILTRFNP